jgi:hypothetical protein
LVRAPPSRCSRTDGLGCTTRRGGLASGARPVRAGACRPPSHPGMAAHGPEPRRAFQAPSSPAEESAPRLNREKAPHTARRGRMKTMKHTPASHRGRRRDHARAATEPCIPGRAAAVGVGVALPTDDAAHDARHGSRRLRATTATMRPISPLRPPSTWPGSPITAFVAGFHRCRGHRGLAHLHHSAIAG